MISRVHGALIARDIDRVEILTSSGLAYEISIPLTVFEQLPSLGADTLLHTYLVVREDAWQLVGFTSQFEKRVFARLLIAKGVGPALAIGMLSTLSAERLVRAIRDKDIATLQSIPRVGRKKAEQLILDLADKMDEIQVDPAPGMRRADSVVADDAVRALVALGYTTGEADKAVRHALEEGGTGGAVPELIRLALTKIGNRS
ncbi:MAG: Holliday junction branch migration protein RuvA [Gemmatimonadaceae bacterium]|nr:Holliday junction branch migration protein RuvA [Gemmatimonadaceae bacterium]MDQ3520571.1 Holliday junction branch migration protein RuvA [Gemmatimonadota bacterium]